MEGSRRFPHYAPPIHASENPLPRYHLPTLPSVPALPVTVLAEGGANTQAIFQFDDIPSDSNDSDESTPSSASRHSRGRSRWSTQTRFANNFHNTAHHSEADYGYLQPSTLDPHHVTSYSQLMILPNQPQSSTYEHTSERPTHGSSVPKRSANSSHMSSSAQQPPQYTRSHGSYERSLAPNLDWKEVEISTAIRMQDMGQPTNWYHPISGERPLADASSISFASRGVSTTGYSNHATHPVIGKCELCGYKDYWPIVEQHRSGCTGPQYR